MTSHRQHYQQINPSVLLDAAGQDLQVFVELTLTFMEIAPPMLTRLLQAIELGNVRAVALESHSLKSTMALIGARQITDLLAQIETLSRSAAMEGIKPLLAELSVLYAATESEVRICLADYRVLAARANDMAPR